MAEVKEAAGEREGADGGGAAEEVVEEVDATTGEMGAKTCCRQGWWGPPAGRKASADHIEGETV